MIVEKILNLCLVILVGEEGKMLRERGIRKGIEVMVKDPINPDLPEKKARVVNVYPHPSSWLVVRFEDGNMKQVEERYVTTMFELNRRGREI